MNFLLEPTGKKVNNPNVDYLKEIIYEIDKAFWKRTDEMTLHYSSPDGDIVLMILHSGIDNTFYLEYMSPDPNVPDDFVVYNTIADKDSSKIVYVCGEPTELPATTFVSADVTFEAVKTFLENGKMADGIEWLKHWDIEWCAGDKECDKD